MNKAGSHGYEIISARRASLRFLGGRGSKVRLEGLKKQFNRDAKTIGELPRYCLTDLPVAV